MVALEGPVPIVPGGEQVAAEALTAEVVGSRSPAAGETYRRPVGDRRVPLAGHRRVRFVPRATGPRRGLTLRRLWALLKVRGVVEDTGGNVLASDLDPTEAVELQLRGDVASACSVR